MERIFAIGDIHGCNEAFQKMLFDEIKIKKEDTIYCIGDYIDRGPDSKGVAETIISLRQQEFQIHTLRGNHEQMMIDSERDEMDNNLWLRNGGNTTLKSFNADSYSSIEEQYRTFYEETKYYISNDDYIFVHAGLNFWKEDIFEDKDAMLWTRDFYPQQKSLGNKILIHGHTPQPLQYILKQKGNCINIDGGCVYTDRKNLGNLIAIALPEKDVIVVNNKK
ncbi:MAG: metallophosphoesterase family protein [Ginsengibacter sp.]